MTERDRSTDDAVADEASTFVRGASVSRPVLLPVGRDDELAAAVHEVQNALTAVTGWIGVARSSTDPSLTSRALEVIDRAINRVRMQVSRLARPHDRFSINPGTFAVDPVLADVCEMLRPRFSAEGVGLMHQPIDSTLVAWGDVDRVTQIILNLVLNALDAVQALAEDTHRGGVKLYAVATADRVHLCVQDEGVGMNENTRARVFEPFFTTHPEAKKGRRKGSGLGLAISRSLAEAMDGTMDIDSTPGEGTTVRLILPRRDDAVTEAIVHDESTMPPGTRVLVVDDEPAIRELLEVALSLRGAEITLAGSLGEARHAIAHGQFDVLLVDDTLGPNESGAAFLIDVSAQIPDTACVLMTGATSLDHLPAKSKRFLVRKPFALDEIVRCIASACESITPRR